MTAVGSASSAIPGPAPIRRVGVLGAGTMGRGIAQSLAEAEIDVVLVDVSDEKLAAARATASLELRRHGRFRVMFQAGSRSADPKRALERISFVTDYERLADVDFVIENVTENWQIKRDVHRRIDALCRPDVVFAVNTSAIPITRVASVTQRPSRVLGMHFMNPAPLMPVVEVIRGYHTSEETLATAKGLLAQMGKESIVVNDSPGFVTNRVMMLTVNEAVFLLHEGVASCEDVDRLFKTCFNHKMGPLEVGDLIGLDTVLYSLEVLCQEFNDDKYRPCPLLKKLVDAGRLGRKSGEGFYRYQ